MGIDINEIRVLLVINKKVTINSGKIESGTVTITSEYGFNKVLDINTTEVILYSGVWTVVAMPEGYTISNIEEIFVGYEVTEENGEIKIRIT